MGNVSDATFQNDVTAKCSIQNGQKKTRIQHLISFPCATTKCHDRRQSLFNALFKQRNLLSQQ